MSRRTATGARLASRRAVLRRLGTGVVAATGAGAAGSAAAQSGGQDVTVLDLRESGDHELPVAAELLVFVHGWLGSGGAAGQTEDLAAGLAAGGYEPDHAVAVQWDASTLDYPAAEARTVDVGAEVAALVEAFADAGGGSVRLVGHSLGGRVVLETLAALSEGYAVDTVAPLGAAADGSTVTEGGRWYDGIAGRAGAVRNYHSANDSTVGSAYGGADDTALGTEGAADPSATPSTYTDVDVTDAVASHTDYTSSPEVGRDLAEAIAAQGDGTETPCDAVDAVRGAEVDGEWACDLDGDGLHRDVTADGDLGQDDVVHFFERQHRDAWQRDVFDFSENGSVGHGDVVALFEDVAVT